MYAAGATFTNSSGEDDRTVRVWANAEHAEWSRHRSLGNLPARSYADYGDYLILSDDREIQRRVRSTGRAMRSLFELVSRRYDSPTVLDFGSGAGYLCKAAEEFGLNAVGVELSDKLTKFSTNRVGFGKVYKQVADAGLEFDAIFMTEVIEHLEPAASREVMTGLLDHLNPGGLLIGSTPNFGSANILLCGDRDPVIRRPIICATSRGRPSIRIFAA